MAIMMKRYAPFSQIKEGAYFYTKRYAETGCEADCLKFYKEAKDKSNCWNPEFGEQTLHPDQQCWFYC